MKDIKIFAVMVVYNKNIEETLTYRSISGKDIRLIVCDNSEGSFDNDKLSKTLGIDYIDMKGNAGLAKAYNRALGHIFENCGALDEDIICLFDDDTRVPDEYFDSVRRDDAGIMLPVVRDGIGIMSPVLMKKSIAVRFRDTDSVFACDVRLLSGINSCMAIRAGLLRNYRYDEEMFLDYIDHKFIMDMREAGVYPKALGVFVKQNFSAVDDDKESARARFSLQKKDLRVFYKNNMMYYYVVIKKHIKLMLKYKDIKMLLK